MGNPRFNDVEILLEEGNFESAGIALGQIIHETHNDISNDEVDEFVNAITGELA